MLLLDALAERRISAAIGDGAFDELEGSGRPLLLDDDSAVPEPMRVAYRILRNSGYLPPEQVTRKEISQVETLLLQVEDEAETSSLRGRLALLQTRLALQGREFDLRARECAYRDKLLRKLR